MVSRSAATREARHTRTEPQHRARRNNAAHARRSARGTPHTRVRRPPPPAARAPSAPRAANAAKRAPRTHVLPLLHGHARDSGHRLHAQAVHGLAGLLLRAVLLLPRRLCARVGAFRAAAATIGRRRRAPPPAPAAARRTSTACAVSSASSSSGMSSSSDFSTSSTSTSLAFALMTAAACGVEEGRAQPHEPKTKCKPGFEAWVASPKVHVR